MCIYLFTTNSTPVLEYILHNTLIQPPRQESAVMPIGIRVAIPDGPHTEVNTLLLYQGHGSLPQF